MLSLCRILFYVIQTKADIHGDANSSFGIQSAEVRRCPINSYKLTACTRAFNEPDVATATNVNPVKPGVPLPSLTVPH
jgi:hypothetical protein